MCFTPRDPSSPDDTRDGHRKKVLPNAFDHGIKRTTIVKDVTITIFSFDRTFNFLWIN